MFLDLGSCKHEDTRLLDLCRSRSPRACIASLFSFPAGNRRLDKPAKQRMRLCRLRFELRMALHRQVPGMVAQLNHFDELAVWTRSCHLQAVGGELLAKLVVEL